MTSKVGPEPPPTTEPVSCTELEEAVTASVERLIDKWIPQDASPAEASDAMSEITEISNRISKEYMEGVKIRKRKTKMQRMETRMGDKRGAAVGDAILEDLAGMKDRNDADGELANIGVDPDTFLDYDVSIIEAGWFSIKVMRTMLSHVVWYTLICWGTVWFVAKILEDLTLEKSADKQFGEGHGYTAAELLGMEEFDDPLGADRSRRAITALIISAQTIYWAGSSM
ncbi:hypothetical protein TrRE_jg11232 [Triparma retinervis]|uniref:Uncharacterized protein n=1 Tax=Triparma retinervis TaxID=2557542 RepID=A0A9W6ZK94_9STRA|nr:hypothetical protein TrRE_jg11232 [Triparma retinervis]